MVKKSNLLKISRTLQITLVISMLVFSPLVSNAEIKLNWDNPNKNGNNPYRFTSNNVLNSDLVMKVIGCTGVVNKISSAIYGFQNATDTITKTAENKAEQKISDAVATYDYKNVEATNETNKIQKQTQSVEQCLNGIALTLARNQLTSMTKYTMNWITTGFSGDPMYVRNANEFMGSITEGVIKKELELTNSDNVIDYPYSMDFSRSYIRTYKNTGKLFTETMKSSLLNYLSDGKEIEDFANDFSVGGWDAWLALTQNEQNNPLGYTMTMSQNITDKRSQNIDDVIRELGQNGGFLSQKECVETDEEAKSLQYAMDLLKLPEEERKNQPSWEKYKADNYSGGFNCTKWENVTPGSIVKSKLETYINSPERQLELSDTINDALNSLFSSLITKFQNEGLTSLASSRTIFSTLNLGGMGSNISDLSNIGSTDGSYNYSDYLSRGYNSSYGYNTFNLITGLGNSYITDKDIDCTKKWDARESVNKTSEGAGLYSGTGNTNDCYTVSVSGNTKLFDENTGWKEGDRAYYDGEKWQNWRKGQLFPIKTRGVIQVQEDYKMAAQQALNSITPVMPALGELDYCIPGPNPNWQSNSQDTETAFENYMDGMTISNLEDNAKWWKNLINSWTSFVSFGISDLFGKGGSWIEPPQKDGTLYNNYKEKFEGSGLWDEVLKSQFIALKEKPGLWSTLVDSREKADAELIQKIDNTASYINESYDEYHNKIRKIYGDASSMQTEFITTEDKTEINSDYLPMASTGLNITKNMVSKNDDLIIATKEYKDGMVQANSNIYKLKQIQTEVDKIIATAQKRRDDELKTLGITIPEKCKDTENIDYVDIVGISTNTGERCDDEIDNDNDNLIDDKDPDCLTNKNLEYNCFDGEDNDGDGFTDLMDTDCDIYRQEENNAFLCNDGEDNDGDGKIDNDDPGCPNYGEVKLIIPGEVPLY